LSSLNGSSFAKSAPLLLVFLVGCGGSDANGTDVTADAANDVVGTDSVVSDGVTADTATPIDTGASDSPNPVDLGKAGAFVILAKAAISTVPTSKIVGDLGVSPAAATYITGFSLIADSTNEFARSTQVAGKVFASNYAPPTPANLTAVIGDMQVAFTDAASRAPMTTELGAGNIGGKTLIRGVYKWGTGLLIPTDVTLSGSATDVWIFQIGKDLTVSSGAKIVMSGGAVAKNVFWQVAGFADVGTTAHVEGIVLTQSAITLHTGASIRGRLMAQTAVSLDGSSVVEP
jgi:hypothetical protein